GVSVNELNDEIRISRTVCQGEEHAALTEHHGVAVDIIGPDQNALHPSARFDGLRLLVVGLDFFEQSRRGRRTTDDDDSRPLPAALELDFLALVFATGQCQNAANRGYGTSPHR